MNVLGKRELPRLDREGIRYRIPTPGLKAEGGAVKVSVELPGFTLRYTTDGSEPSPSSPVVPSQRPLEGPSLRTGEVPSLPGPQAGGVIPLRGTVSVAAFDTTGRKGHTARLTAP